VKEYITKSRDGSYILVNHKFTERDIEVPEGAECLIECNGGCLFFKEHTVFDNIKKWWFESGYNDGEGEYLSKETVLQTYGGKLLWERNGSEETQTKEYDIVNKPKHYNSDPSGVQCIELTRCLSSDAANALKYIWRDGKKDEILQERKKAQWYVNDLIEYDVPIAIEGLGDTIEFEDKVKKVLATWSGWKYIFLNALYWNDKQEMKRAIDALVNEAETDK